MIETETDDTLVIEGVHIVPDGGQPAIPKGRIVVQGDLISRVEPVGEAPAPTAERVFDGTGLIALPGLVNVHTHAILTMVRGVAEDMGFAPAYTPGVPQGHMVTPEEAVALARLGALEAMKFGSTLIGDTYVHQDLTVPAMADLGLRVWSSGRVHDVDFSGVSKGRWKYDTDIGRRTLDACLALHQQFHGTADGRIGVQIAAHAPDTCSTDFLKEIREARDTTGLTVTTHLSQSKIEVARIQERDGMSPPELLDSLGLLSDQLIAAHCIHLGETDINRIGNAGVHVAHIPKGNATGGTIAPTRKLTEAGANLCLCTDNMHADMIEVMRWALAMGRVQTETVEDGWDPGEMLTMATRNGARAMGLQDQLGALEPGRKADIVLVDAAQPHFTPLLDALGAITHVGHGRDVKHVIINGEVVVENHRALRVDEEMVMQEAQAAAEALWQRARDEVS
ncbi:MAG: amidohydrolase family protein [Pseudomonadota bacterium]